MDNNDIIRILQHGGKLIVKKRTTPNASYKSVMILKNGQKKKKKLSTNMKSKPKCKKCREMKKSTSGINSMFK
jgi:hypothetical protein